MARVYEDTETLLKILKKRRRKFMSSYDLDDDQKEVYKMIPFVQLEVNDGLISDEQFEEYKSNYDYSKANLKEMLKTSPPQEDDEEVEASSIDLENKVISPELCTEFDHSLDENKDFNEDDLESSINIKLDSSDSMYSEESTLSIKEKLPVSEKTIHEENDMLDFEEDPSSDEAESDGNFKRGRNESPPLTTKSTTLITDAPIAAKSSATITASTSNKTLVTAQKNNILASNCKSDNTLTHRTPLIDSEVLKTTLTSTAPRSSTPIPKTTNFVKKLEATKSTEPLNKPPSNRITFSQKSVPNPPSDPTNLDFISKVNKELELKQLPNAMKIIFANKTKISWNVPSHLDVLKKVSLLMIDLGSNVYLDQVLQILFSTEKSANEHEFWSDFLENIYNKNLISTSSIVQLYNFLLKHNGSLRIKTCRLLFQCIDNTVKKTNDQIEPVITLQATTPQVAKRTPIRPPTPVANDVKRPPNLNGVTKLETPLLFRTDLPPNLFPEPTKFPVKAKPDQDVAVNNGQINQCNPQVQEWIKFLKEKQWAKMLQIYMRNTKNSTDIYQFVRNFRSAIVSDEEKAGENFLKIFFPDNLDMDFLNDNEAFTECCKFCLDDLAKKKYIEDVSKIIKHLITHQIKLYSANPTDLWLTMENHFLKEACKEDKENVATLIKMMCESLSNKFNCQFHNKKIINDISFEQKNVLAQKLIENAIAVNSAVTGLKYGKLLLFGALLILRPFNKYNLKQCLNLYTKWFLNGNFFFDAYELWSFLKSLKDSFESFKLLEPNSLRALLIAFRSSSKYAGACKEIFDLGCKRGIYLIRPGKKNGELNELDIPPNLSVEEMEFFLAQSINETQKQRSLLPNYSPSSDLVDDKLLFTFKIMSSEYDNASMDQDFTLLELENSCKHAYNRLSIAVFNLDLSRFVEDNKVKVTLVLSAYSSIKLPGDLPFICPIPVTRGFENVLDQIEISLQDVPNLKDPRPVKIPSPKKSVPAKTVNSKLIKEIPESCIPMDEKEPSTVLSELSTEKSMEIEGPVSNPDVSPSKVLLDKAAEEITKSKEVKTSSIKALKRKLSIKAAQKMGKKFKPMVRSTSKPIKKFSNFVITTTSTSKERIIVSSS